MRDKNRGGAPDTRAGARTDTRSAANTSATRAKEAGGKGRAAPEPVRPAASGPTAAKERAGGFGAEVEALRKELDERTSDLQRLTAEYANYRRRVDRDRALVVEQATGAVLSELLGVLDDVDRARNHGDLVGPFGAVAEQLNSVLSKLGLTALGEAGEEFDPTRHEAVAHSYSSKVDQPTCVEVFRRGYALGERLLRPALVAVAEPGDDEEPEPEQAAEPEQPAKQEQTAEPSEVEAVAAAAGVTAKERDTSTEAKPNGTGAASKSNEPAKSDSAAKAASAKSDPAAKAAGAAQSGEAADVGAGEAAQTVEPDVVDADVVEPEPGDAEVIDAEVIDAEVVEDEVVEGELVDAEASAVADQAEAPGATVESDQAAAKPTAAPAPAQQAASKKSDRASDEADDREAAKGSAASGSKKAEPEEVAEDTSGKRKPQFRGTRSDTTQNTRGGGTRPGKRDG